jgi:hypothetical protein
LPPIRQELRDHTPLFIKDVGRHAAHTKTLPCKSQALS